MLCFFEVSSCTLKLLNFLNDSKHALIKLYLVVVCPCVFVYASLIPASDNNFLHSFCAIKAVPFGAGINLMTTEPHAPSTSNGTLCPSLQPHVQEPQPLLILKRFNFAFLTAFSLAGTVSAAFPV